MPKDLISYEGNTASELYEDFKGAVDDYLELCKNNGRKPHKILFRHAKYTHIVGYSLQGCNGGGEQRNKY